MKQTMKPLALIFLALTVVAPLATAQKPEGTTATVETTWNGTAREYSIYKPSALATNPAMIVYLHSTKADTTGSKPPVLPGGLMTYADRFGFVLVAPLSTWNASTKSWLWDAEGMDGMFRAGTDDSGFLRNVIETVSAEYSTLAYVYALGLSSGGFMAYRLAIDSTNDPEAVPIAAIASASGALWADSSTFTPASAPFSALQIDGSDDTEIKPCGGTTSAWKGKTPIASTDQTIDYVLSLDGLALPAQGICTAGSLTPGMYGYAASGNGVEVQFVMEVGQGHGGDSVVNEVSVVWLLGHGTGASRAPTTTTVTSSLNPSAYGLAVGFTANVTSGSGTPTGTVQFNIDGSTFSSPVTLASGSATSGSISTLTEGTHTVTAVYSGSSNFATSTGTLSGGQVVNEASAGVSVASSLNPSTFGQSVTLTATINGEYGLVKGRHNTKRKPQDVSGTVAWTSNGVAIAGCESTTVTTGNPGAATCTTSSLAVGTDAIAANYSGDSNHSPSTGTLNQAVNSAGTTIAVTSVSPAAEGYGLDAPVTITAVLSWTGSGAAPTASAVTIGGNGPSAYSATSCGAPSGTTMTCTATYTPTIADGAGSYTETASFGGDGNYNGSSSTQTNNFTIN
jgi:poly(3-hydroxybutyrate) depolymerase